MFSVLFGPSGHISLVVCIPWLGPGLCNDGALLIITKPIAFELGDSHFDTEVRNISPILHTQDGPPAAEARMFDKSTYTEGGHLPWSFLHLLGR